MITTDQNVSHNSAPRKRFGQHFLTSTFHSNRIAESVPATAEDNVLEIGAGRGALSIQLVKRFPRFHLIEIDRDAIPILSEKLGQGDWTLHNCNALDFDLSEAGENVHVVGNLPYNVGALIIKKMLLSAGRVSTCTFMVQREVAERIVSGPGTKKIGYLSIFCQYFGTPRILFHVPPGAFFPKPKVDSSVFQIILDQSKWSRLPRDEWQNFFAFADRAFKMRRKTLAKVLGYHGNKDQYIDIIQKLGHLPTVRPEELGIDAWVELFMKVCDEGL